METAVIPVDDRALLDTSRNEFAKAMENMAGFVVSDQDTLEQGTDVVKVLRLGVRDLERVRVEQVTPYNDKVKAINRDFKAVMYLADLVIKPVSREIAGYHQRLEAQLRAEAEKERQVKLKRLAEEEGALKAAAEIEGTLETAEEAAVVEDQRRKLETADLKVSTITHGKLGSSSLRRNWTYRVKNIKNVPAMYLLHNGVAINGAIRRGTRNIEGLEIYQETTATFR